MALKNEGCTHILATTAVGSLKEEINMGDFVLVDQVFDRTYRRQTTFYDGQPESPEGVCHIPMHEPFCVETRKVSITDISMICKNLLSLFIYVVASVFNSNHFKTLLVLMKL